AGPEHCWAVPPPTAQQQIRVVADRLSEPAAPAGPGELAGETVALAAFSRTVPPVGAPLASRTPRAESRRLVAARRAGAAAAVAVPGIGLSGTAAACAGVASAPKQEFAHRVIGAPAAHRAAAHRSGIQPPGVPDWGGRAKPGAERRDQHQGRHEAKGLA